MLSLVLMLLRICQFQFDQSAIVAFGKNSRRNSLERALMGMQFVPERSDEQTQRVLERFLTGEG